MTRRDFGTKIIETNDYQEGIRSFDYQPVGTKRTYGVLLVSENEKSERLQIHYEIDVICLDKTDDDNFEFELNKHQIYIDEKAPDSLVDELSDRCGKVLYPLCLKVTRSGYAIDILNQEDIIERWTTEKKSINQSYKGKEIDLLLKNMDHVIYNKHQLADLLIQRDWFITLFFAPLFNINPKNTKGNKISIPFIPYSPGVVFEIKNKISPHSHKKDNVIIKLKGKCIDSRSERDILRGNLISIDKNEKSVKGKLDIEYHFYKDSSIANAITGVCSLEFPSKKIKKMSIEMYHLKNKIPRLHHKKLDSSSLLIEEEENIPKKKKKRFFFFGK